MALKDPLVSADKPKATSRFQLRSNASRAPFRPPGTAAAAGILKVPFHRRRLRDTWDSAPFNTAPGITKPIIPLNIPQTKIPSPFAQNLHPTTLIDLKRYLAGNDGGSYLEGFAVGYGGSGSGSGGPLPGGNGVEIWKSWKRAFDIWNNFYIEGRVNDVWVGRELELVDIEKREGRGNWSVGVRQTILPPEGTNAPGRYPVTQRENTQEDIVMEGVQHTDELPAGQRQPQGNLDPNADGNGGGWFAMKNFPEYYEPPPNVYNASGGWIDILDNSVWMPRRVGEKEPRIDLDEEYSGAPEFEMNGGVDCTREPCPVLRSAMKSAKRTSDKKTVLAKTWDGVTGTIFNIPTQPVDPVTGNDVDENTRIVEAMYGDVLQKSPERDIFPLDIRRVFKEEGALKTTEAVRGTTIMGDEGSAGTTEEPPDLQTFYESVKPDDPWWVTAKQRKLRAQSTREPSPEEEVDTERWDHEVWKDQNYKARYFVANLDGRTLIINGMELKKGQVAGPLPEFAVIECPGGQIAFWWGVDGRNWMEGPNGDHSTAWRTLRRLKGWDYAGLTAGQVWEAKVREKRRDMGGDELEDEPEDWARCRRAARLAGPDENHVGTRVLAKPLPPVDDGHILQSAMAGNDVTLLLPTHDNVQTLSRLALPSSGQGTLPDEDLRQLAEKLREDNRMHAESVLSTNNQYGASSWPKSQGITPAGLNLTYQPLTQEEVDMISGLGKKRRATDGDILLPTKKSKFDEIDTDKRATKENRASERAVRRKGREGEQKAMEERRRINFETGIYDPFKRTAGDDLKKRWLLQRKADERYRAERSWKRLNETRKAKGLTLLPPLSSESSLSSDGDVEYARTKRPLYEEAEKERQRQHVEEEEVKTKERERARKLKETRNELAKLQKLEFEKEERKQNLLEQAGKMKFLQTQKALEPTHPRLEIQSQVESSSTVQPKPIPMPKESAKPDHPTGPSRPEKSTESAKPSSKDVDQEGVLHQRAASQAVPVEEFKVMEAVKAGYSSTEEHVKDQREESGTYIGLPDTEERAQKRLHFQHLRDKLERLDKEMEKLRKSKKPDAKSKMGELRKRRDVLLRATNAIQAELASLTPEETEYWEKIADEAKLKLVDVEMVVLTDGSAHRKGTV